MKALVLKGANEFEVKEVPLPVISEGDLLIKTKSTAICGTDIRILEGKKTKDIVYPAIIGHEICGEICEIDGVYNALHVGDIIAIANVLPCHKCESCRKGHENVCMDRQAIGYEYDGGFAEYVRIPKVFVENGNVVRLSAGISTAEGSLIEPLACCIRGMKNAGTKFGDDVLVIGAGPIGLMHVMLAKRVGAKKVVVSEPNQYRRNMAEKVGADIVVNPNSEDIYDTIKKYCGGGCDVVIIAIGVPSVVNQAIDLCRKGGTVNLFAGFTKGETCDIDVNKIHYNEINMNGSSAYKIEDYYLAAELIASRKIVLSDIISHVYELEAFDEAYRTCKSGSGLKVVINF